jgi:hypothetical protein
VDNNYLDLGMNKSGFVHTLPSGSLTTILNHLGEKIETSHQHLRRRHQRCVTLKPQRAPGLNDP